jgi:hypothetical protein
MRVDVYLLSIPLARHRTIVPRRRDASAMIQADPMQGPEPHRLDVMVPITDSPRRAESLHQVDSD